MSKVKEHMASGDYAALMPQAADEAAIVQRLRSIATGPSYAWSNTPNNILREAADTIATLTARAETAEAKVATAAYALAPFAECEPMHVWSGQDEDDSEGFFVLTENQFQLAKTAHDAITQEMAK